MTFLYLIANEITKMVRKRRFQVVILILFALMLVFSYGEWKASNALTQQLGTTDWHVRLQQEITNDINHLHSPFLSNPAKAAIQAAISEGQYEFAHNINPFAPGAPSFMRVFMDEGITLLIPLFVIVIASDMVSSEISGGTIKMILTRGVSRFRVLGSKLIALFLLTSLMIGVIAISSYVISGLYFGYAGFGLPVLIGFHTMASGYVQLTHVYTVPQWKYLLMSYGLGYFTCLCIGCMAFMVSTLVRSTASSMGIMMAALIGGTLLTSFAGNWSTAKYIPMVNLQLSGYLNGSPPPVTGMTFGFSMTILAVWAIVCILISFTVFTRKDIMG